jgi:hypothetical protein
LGRGQDVVVERRPSVKVTAADWLSARLRDFGSGVASVVPDGFSAYVRVLHPARGVDGEQVSWATVAAWSGRRMHRLVQFHAIARPLFVVQDNRAPWNGESPENGNLPIDLLRALCRVLGEHTRTPDRCWLCLWEGYGYLDDVLPAEVRDGPRVQLPHRAYVLFEGSLETATEPQEPFGRRVGTAFFPQSPNLFWPQDQAWCVATEIDLYCTLVAGSESLAQALLADCLFTHLTLPTTERV